MKKFRKRHRRSRTQQGTGRHAWTIGLRLGYWPCLKGPFVVVEIATHRFDFWYGLPSYEA
jgi:hypothetical protein